ncbi:hypothetical protein ACFGVR_14055 [Mucilaginibacter sp. AW1-3]
MEIKVEIPEYDVNSGLISHWEDGFEITTNIVNDQISITANKAGLISLAMKLLTLAQDSVPIGGHFHFDEYNSLEPGSVELVVEKR